MIKTDIPFRDASTTEELARLDLYNFSAGSQAWWDEILIATEEFPAWVIADSSSGTIPAGDSLQIEIIFDPANMNTGNYYADIIINSNDPYKPGIEVPAHLHVIEGSGIDDVKIPKVFFVKQNYPNPFSRQTTIFYGCPRRSKVCIQVFDCVGRLVNTLLDEEIEAGYHEVKWDGSNKFGRRLANAVYFYRMQAGDFITTKKMIFLP